MVRPCFVFGLTHIVSEYLPFCVVLLRISMLLAHWTFADWNLGELLLSSFTVEIRHLDRTLKRAAYFAPFQYVDIYQESLCQPICIAIWLWKWCMSLSRSVVPEYCLNRGIWNFSMISPIWISLIKGIDSSLSSHPSSKNHHRLRLHRTGLSGLSPILVPQLKLMKLKRW